MPKQWMKIGQWVNKWHMSIQKAEWINKQISEWVSELTCPLIYGHI